MKCPRAAESPYRWEQMIYASTRVDLEYARKDEEGGNNERKRKKQANGETICLRDLMT
jgi:hypothetical protein